MKPSYHGEVNLLSRSWSRSSECSAIETQTEETVVVVCKKIRKMLWNFGGLKRGNLYGVGDNGDVGRWG